MITLCSVDTLGYPMTGATAMFAGGASAGATSVSFDPWMRQKSAHIDTALVGRRQLLGRVFKVDNRILLPSVGERST